MTENSYILYKLYQNFDFKETHSNYSKLYYKQAMFISSLSPFI